jgi:hypothetical protein
MLQCHCLLLTPTWTSWRRCSHHRRAHSSPPSPSPLPPPPPLPPPRPTIALAGEESGFVLAIDLRFSTSIRTALSRLSGTTQPSKWRTYPTVCGPVPRFATLSARQELTPASMRYASVRRLVQNPEYVGASRVVLSIVDRGCRVPSVQRGALRSGRVGKNNRVHPKRGKGNGSCIFHTEVQETTS